MTERQAHRFLRRNRERSICVAYRAAPDGRVRFRKSDAVRTLHALSLPFLIGGLGACASLGRELEVPDEMTCLQNRGYRVDCDDPAFVGYGWTPNADEASEPEGIRQIDDAFTEHEEPTAEFVEAEHWPESGDASREPEHDRDEHVGYDDDIMMGGVMEPATERHDNRRSRRRIRSIRRERRLERRTGRES